MDHTQDHLLRAVRPDDADAIAALMSLPGFRWGTTQLPFQSAARVRAHLERDAGDSRTIVAEAGEALVGHATLERGRGRRSHAGAIGLGVHDDWTARGIGTALMRALVELADDWLGLRRLELSVVTDNAAALALYDRFGFTVEGTHRGWILRGGKLVDVHTMARLRAAPDQPGRPIAMER